MTLTLVASLLSHSNLNGTCDMKGRCATFRKPHIDLQFSQHASRWGVAAYSLVLAICAATLHSVQHVYVNLPLHIGARYARVPTSPYQLCNQLSQWQYFTACIAVKYLRSQNDTTSAWDSPVFAVCADTLPASRVPSEPILHILQRIL